METYIILISVYTLDAEKICDRLEGQEIEDFDHHPDLQDLRDYLLYHVSDFTGLVNKGELDKLNEYYIASVKQKS